MSMQLNPQESLQEQQEKILEGIRNHQAQGQEEPQQEESELPSEHIPRSDYEALQSQNSLLQRRLEVLTQNMMSPEYVEFLQARRAGGGRGIQPHTTQAPAAPEPDLDVDNATPKQIADFVIKKVMSAVEPQLGEVKDKAQNTEYQMQVSAAQREIAELKAKNPDFEFYRMQMVDLSRKHPTMSPSELYVMAKAKGAPAGGGAARPAPKKLPAKTTVEKPGTSAPTKTKDKLTISEALEEAWKKVGL